MNVPGKVSACGMAIRLKTDNRWQAPEWGMATSTRQRLISVVTVRPNSDSISISLQDTGPGIGPSKLASIFDAFVTT